MVPVGRLARGIRVPLRAARRRGDLLVQRLDAERGGGFTSRGTKSCWATADARAAGNSWRSRSCPRAPPRSWRMAGIAMHRYRMAWLPLLVSRPWRARILLGSRSCFFFRQVLDLTLGSSPSWWRTSRLHRIRGRDRARAARGMDRGSRGGEGPRRDPVDDLPPRHPAAHPAGLWPVPDSFTLSIDDFVITFFVRGWG